VAGTAFPPSRKRPVPRSGLTALSQLTYPAPRLEGARLQSRRNTLKISRALAPEEIRIRGEGHSSDRSPLLESLSGFASYLRSVGAITVNVSGLPPLLAISIVRLVDSGLRLTFWPAVQT